MSETWDKIKNVMFGTKNNDSKYFKDILKGKKKKVDGFHPSKTNHDYAKKAYGIHFIFKYRIFIPLLYFADKLCSRFKVTKIPNKEVLKNLSTFDKAFDKATLIWMNNYVMISKKYSEKELKEEIANSPSANILKSMKEWVITICLYDNAYREFLNTFIYLLVIEINKQGPKATHIFQNNQQLTEVEFINVLKQYQERIVFAKKEIPGEQSIKPK
jgi:hypothetical protein